MVTTRRFKANPCDTVRPKCRNKRFTCVPDYCGGRHAVIYDYTGKIMSKCFSKCCLSKFVQRKKLQKYKIKILKRSIIKPNVFTIESCKNLRNDERCNKLAKKGYCHKKRVNYMKKNCKKTCGLCGKKSNFISYNGLLLESNPYQ